MNLEALDAIMEATRKKRLAWQKINPERFETVGEPKVSIQFHYPQVGDESTTGADIAVITFGGVSLSVFAGTEGMAKARTILGAAFVDWQEHLKSIDAKIEVFIKEITSDRRPGRE